MTVEDDVREVIKGKNLVGYTREWVLEYPSVGRMAVNIIRRKRGSVQTFLGYLEAVKNFVRFLKVDNPETALNRLQSGDATRICDDFIEYLTSTSLSPRTIKRLYYGLQKWTTVNDVDVNWDKIDIPKVGGRVQDRIPTSEELKTIYAYMSLRDKAIFTVMLSSGLRVGTLIQLKVGDVDFDSSEDIAVIQVKGGEGRKLSEGSSFFTFITPEARRVLREYLDWRQRKGEKIGKDSFLIVESNERPYAYGHHVSRRWRNLLRKAGFKNMTDEGWMEIHLHCLRKTFQTRCKSAGISPSYYDFWMGHTTSDYLDDAYWRETLKKHAEEYRKAVPQLSFLEESKVISKEEIRTEVIGAFMGKISDAELASIASRLGISPGQIRSMMKRIGVKGSEEETEALLESERNGNNNHYETKLITEEELCEYLDDGWDLVKELSSRKILVRKPGF